jgi:hypothetical protein
VPGEQIEVTVTGQREQGFSDVGSGAVLAGDDDRRLAVVEEDFPAEKDGQEIGVDSAGDVAVAEFKDAADVEDTGGPAGFYSVRQIDRSQVMAGSSKKQKTVLRQALDFSYTMRFSF